MKCKKSAKRPNEITWRCFTIYNNDDDNDNDDDQMCVLGENEL